MLGIATVYEVTVAAYRWVRRRLSVHTMHLQSNHCSPAAPPTHPFKNGKSKNPTSGLVTGKKSLLWILSVFDFFSLSLPSARLKANKCDSVPAGCDTSSHWAAVLPAVIAACSRSWPPILGSHRC